MLDNTKINLLEELAQRLEAKAGIIISAAVRAEPSEEAKLRRIIDAVDGFAGAIETHDIPDHGDVGTLAPNDRDIFMYDAVLAAWKANTLVLTDLPPIDIDALSDVVVNSPVDGHFLRNNGFNWINTFLSLGDLPAIGLNDLSDVTISGLGTYDILLHAGPGYWTNTRITAYPFCGDIDFTVIPATNSVWINDNTVGVTLKNISYTTFATGIATQMATALGMSNYLKKDGTVALTGNWSAGAYLIRAKEFQVENNTANLGCNYVYARYPSASIIDTTDGFSGIRRGFYFPFQRQYNNAAGEDYGRFRAIDISMAFTTPAALDTFCAPQIINATITADANTAYDNIPVYMSVTNNKLNQAFTDGAYNFTLTAGATSGTCISVKAESSISGSGNLLAYQGYAQGIAGATGNIVGLQGYCGVVNTLASVTGVSSLPQAAGTGPANSLIMAYFGARGHWLASRASLFVTSTARTNPAAFSTTHLTHTSLQGAGYFEGALEVDGTAYFDGALAHVGSTLGVFNTTPAARTAAYTQTYATATRTHAAPTAATLTDSSGGSADQTVAAVSGTPDDATINNNFAEVTDEINKLIADLANIKQVVNSVIDDQQIYGFFQ